MLINTLFLSLSPPLFLPQVLSSVYYVQSFCKLLQSATIHSEDLPLQREIFKPLLNNLISILTLSVTDLGIDRDALTTHV